MCVGGGGGGGQGEDWGRGRACMRACVRACVYVCVCACVRACVRACEKCLYILRESHEFTTFIQLIMYMFCLSAANVIVGCDFVWNSMYVCRIHDSCSEMSSLH